MQAIFERFTLTITKAQAQQGAHPGPCDTDIAELLTVPALARQFKHISADDIREELRVYGAWDKQELASDSDNQARILWIACANVLDEIRK